MTFPCQTCGGRHGWWVDDKGDRAPINPDHPLGQGLVYVNVPGVFAGHVHWRECHDCIGGIASCCDGAGSSQPEPGTANE